MVQLKKTTDKSKSLELAPSNQEGGETILQPWKVLISNKKQNHNFLMFFIVHTRPA